MNNVGVAQTTEPAFRYSWLGGTGSSTSMQGCHGLGHKFQEHMGGDSVLTVKQLKTGGGVLGEFSIIKMRS